MIGIEKFDAVSKFRSRSRVHACSSAIDPGRGATGAETPPNETLTARARRRGRPRRRFRHSQKVYVDRYERTAMPQDEFEEALESVLADLERDRRSLEETT